MKRPIVVAAMASLVLSSAPALLHQALVSPRFGRTPLAELTWKCFLVLAYPPVYLSNRLGWYDALQGDVLKGVSVFQPPPLLTMLWTHSVVAIPFWFLLILALLLAFRSLASDMESARGRRR
jgi:hypothetical protein